MNNTDPLDDHEAVFTALQLFGNEPRGAPPQWHELDDFQQHRLPVERSAEILSHIANNPTCFQQWLDLCEAGEWIADQSHYPVHEAVPDASPQISPANAPLPSDSPSLISQVRGWIAPLFAQPLPVYGGAFAAVILAVLVVPLIRDSGSLDLQGKFERNTALYLAAAPEQDFVPPNKPVTRSLGGLLGGPTMSDIEQHYFRAGLLQAQEKLLDSPGEQWNSWREALTSGTLDCAKATDADQCLAVGPDFMQTGEWAMLVHLACQSPKAFNDTAFWQLQYELYQELQLLPAMSHSELVRPAMATHQPAMPDAMCFAVGELIKVGQ